jgi:hypothetical protein
VLTQLPVEVGQHLADLAAHVVAHPAELARQHLADPDQNRRRVAGVEERPLDRRLDAAQQPAERLHAGDGVGAFSGQPERPELGGLPRGDPPSGLLACARGCLFADTGDLLRHPEQLLLQRQHVAARRDLPAATPQTSVFNAATSSFRERVADARSTPNPSLARIDSRAATVAACLLAAISPRTCARCRNTFTSVVLEGGAAGDVLRRLEPPLNEGGDLVQSAAIWPRRVRTSWTRPRRRLISAVEPLVALRRGRAEEVVAAVRWGIAAARRRVRLRLS